MHLDRPVAERRSFCLVSEATASDTVVQGLTPESRSREADMNSTASVFPGQGSQRVGMGLDFLQRRPNLNDTYCRTAGEIPGFPLSEMCRHGPAAALQDTSVTQPAVFLTSLIVLDVLRAHDVEPDVVARHSPRRVHRLGGCGRTAVDRRTTARTATRGVDGCGQRSESGRPVLPALRSWYYARRLSWPFLEAAPLWTQG